MLWRVDCALLNVPKVLLKMNFGQQQKQLSFNHDHYIVDIQPNRRLSIALGKTGVNTEWTSKAVSARASEPTGRKPRH
jgi:hypothetical protein